jgi:ATP/maltotriose-dependent transcriptional regulator MalT
MARAAGRAALREELDRAVALAPDTRLGVFGRGPAVNRAVCLVYDERLDEARDVFEGVAAEARERGHEVDLAIALFQLGELECRAGRYAEAERHARAMMEGFVVENPQDRSGTMYVLAWAEAFMGRVDDARAHAREGARLSRETGDQLFWSQNEAVLGFLELSLGNLAAADRHLRPLWPAVTALGYGEPSVWPVLPNEIEALIGMGELEPAEAFLAELEERGRALDSAWALSQAARCRGLLLAATGAPQEALGAFAAALEQHRRMAGGFERARTLLAQGRTLRRMKRWREAREALQAALAIFEELGTPLWVAQAREALARIGGRAPGRDSLTSTEQRVAALVAEGRSNREVAAQLFVSVRTVEASLTRIYAKLGVRSRAQLARRLASGSPPFR